VAPPSATTGDARAYHDRTKHSWTSVRQSRHTLDWAIKPFPFKVYPDAPLVPLPREVQPPATPALEALGRVAVSGPGGVDLAALAALLFFSAGLTRKKTYAGGEAIHFRAAPSTGALYEVEAYVVAGAIGDLAAGVYHFAPGEFALRQLRTGDWRAVLAEASSEPARVRAAPVTLILTAITWRNSWKYQARAYRHFFWDTGTLLANLLATAVALGVPARVLLAFADAAVDALLGLTDGKEQSLVLVPLGTGASPPPSAPAVPPLYLAALPLSAREVDEPLVRAAVRASALPDGESARRWAGAGRPAEAESPGGAEAGVIRRPAIGAAGLGLGETILRRGSTRVFSRTAISDEELGMILDTALADDLPLDAGAVGPPPVETYVLVHAVDGRPPGAYAWSRTSRALRLLREGAFRADGGRLCLEQALGADASAVVFFLADLGPPLARQGNRGYRTANLVAGLYGGRMYLAAYALGLGATGLTFYDDEVVDFFSPDAAGLDAIFVTAVGRARPSERPRDLGLARGRIVPTPPGAR
jgi:SagB-type dehydrogenase family enzyme